MTSVYVNMLHSLKQFQCPHCNSLYTSKDKARCYNVVKFPRILTCSHSVCENCLHAADNKQTTFSCPVCKENVELSNENLQENFLPDVHALGIISANEKNSLPSLKIKTASSSQLKRNQSQESVRTPGPGIICGRCNKEQALWQCGECQLNFCSLCYKEAHIGNSKKGHEGKKIFAELYNSLVQEGCRVHENKTVEFFCEVDGELTCSYCMLMGEHVGHEVKTLADKNRSCAEDLKNILEDLTTMQKQLKYTDYLLCEKIPSERLDISDIIKNVHDHFHTLHANLQLREVELISELTTISQRNVKPLEEMRLKVTNYERELASVRKDAESVIENPCLAISAPAILKKLEESKNHPCYLVPLPGESEKKFNLNVVLPENLEKEIKNFGEIHFDGKARFVLMPGDDLPEDFSREIPESFISKSPDMESGSESFSVFSEDSLSVPTTSSHSAMQASLKCRDFNKLQPEKVIVSFVKNPSSFYVQRYSELRKLNSMLEAIDRWCKHSDARKCKVHAVETGDLYLVRYNVDNKWYRGRVKRVLKPDDPDSIGKVSPMKDESGKISISKGTLVEVFYIDFGNTETISFANMKPIQARFLKMPGMAKHCCLAGIQPNGDQWSSESIKSFGRFVTNKPVIMKVFEETNNVLHVDLSQTTDDISSDVPVSVRDALVFLEEAVFECGTNFAPKKVKNERNCMPPESLCVNSNVCVIVSHVDDPSNFYVQQISTASYLAGTIFEMNEAYNKEMNSMLHGIYAPRIGMVCAAQYSVDKQWYRARVIDLPGGAKVKVQYVDFGNTEVVHHKFLRKLLDRFYKLNIQAIPCKLAQVTYNQAKGWKLEAKKWLAEKCSRKHLMLKSLGTIPGENKAEVVLTFVEDEFEICVNALMVEEGFAESTGKYSRTVRKKIDAKSPKKEPEQKEPCQEEPDSIMTLHDIHTEAIPPPVPPVQCMPLCIQEETSNNHLQSNSEPESSKRSPQRKYPSLAPPTLAEGTSYLEVHVSHVETPDSFYIQVATDQDKLNKLMNDLQVAYEHLDGEIEYTVGKAYAVYSKTQKKWLRGTVLSKISEEKVKIHYVDFGNSEEVSKKDLRKLMEKFHADESFSVRCHLDGIIPTGGSSKWSHTACDRFNQMIAPHEVLLLSSKGDFNKETKSLPADLLIESLIRGGALEPTKIEFISITKELINKGMGLPIRVKDPRPTASKPSEISESKTFESTKDITEISQQSGEMANHIADSNVFNAINYTDIVPTEDTLPPLAKPTFQWKPAVPPLESIFKGFVTNVGDDGSIHLYVVGKEGTSQVDTMKKAMKFKYNKGTYECLKKAPAIGEACVAKFSVDKEWYRAEIISVYHEKVKVNFVDYGNNEIIPFSDIRLDIILKDFPRQCQECALFEIKDSLSEKWDNDLLTFLHTQLVETYVTVEILAPSDEKGRLQCKITTSSGINIAELLLSMGFGDSTDDSVSNAIPTNQIVKTFARASELRAGDILPVCVSQVNGENIVHLQILKITNPKDEYEKKHNETHKAFLQLIKELRENADSFPKINDPLPGMPCCAKYSYDNDWYRCEITDLTENGVVVLYVDYGNSEEISCDNLRELKSNFIDFPVQTHFCELHGLKPAGNEWDPDVKEALVKTIVTNQELFAKVVVSGNISQVDLLIKAEDGSLKLAYEELITNDLVILEKTRL